MTALRECATCGLRYRTPKESGDHAAQFYQNRYQAGFTTDLPNSEELRDLIAKGFRGTEKDYAVYVKVLRGLSLRPGDSILDYGSSWGYGSRQLRDAGYNVFSYEVSKPRADYAERNLGCRVVRQLADLPQHVDLFFSAHVVEHLPDPNTLWIASNQVLKPGGLLVCFTPNAEPIREPILGSRIYHQLWGQVHPLILNRRALENMAIRHGYTPLVYSSPYPWGLIEARLPVPLEAWSNHVQAPGGDELLLVAVRDNRRIN